MTLGLSGSQRLSARSRYATVLHGAGHRKAAALAGLAARHAETALPALHAVGGAPLSALIAALGLYRQDLVLGPHLNGAAGNAGQVEGDLQALPVLVYVGRRSEAAELRRACLRLACRPPRPRLIDCASSSILRNASSAFLLQMGMRGGIIRPTRCCLDLKILVCMYQV